MALLSLAAAAAQEPKPVVEGDEVVITATRSPAPAAASPTPVRVVTGDALRAGPGKSVDEALRADPGFGLFRRSSSLVADPTSQGATLRGLGPSAVPRALVLVDGVPAGDAFGGWVYWGSFPRLDVERIEIAPGGGSALWGGAALAGVIQVVSRPIEDAFDAEVEAAAPATGAAALRFAHVAGDVRYQLGAEGSQSAGYFIVKEGDRGPVDRRARSGRATAQARAEVAASSAVTLGLRGSFFSESQNGGTQFTSAAVWQAGLVASASVRLGAAGSLEARLFARGGLFEQDRARIAPNDVARQSEALSAHQSVPSRDQGGSAAWSSSQESQHRFTAGIDVRRATGTSTEEIAQAAPDAVARREAGGEQWSFGAFAHDAWQVASWANVSAGVRADGWRDRSGSIVETLGSGGRSTDQALAQRTATALSPRAGVVLRPAAWVQLRAAAYQGFRAPNLNELYRPFQVGQVRTEANPQLDAEVSRGGELGIDATMGALHASATAFSALLLNPIANVTIGPSLQQRQNLGYATVRGVEARAVVDAAHWLRATAAYQYVEPQVRAASAAPQLVGKDLAQDPRHRATFEVKLFPLDGIELTAQARVVSRQFDDDLNTRVLRAHALVDLAAVYRFLFAFEAFLAVENVFDTSYEVSLAAGVPQIGQPRFVRAGLRMKLR